MSTCVYVCVTSNQSTREKPYYVLDHHTKLDVLMHKTHIKVLLVPRPDKCRSRLSLNKIAHQMRHDHPFSQKNRGTERIVEVEVRGNTKVDGVVEQNLRKKYRHYNGSS